MQTQDNPVAASPLERRLDMSLALAEIDREVDAKLRKLSRTVKMPGFRPGKVPFRIVAQQYGPQARSEAIGEAVQKAFGSMVRDHNLRVAGMPRIEPGEGSDTEKLAFRAVFEVYPDIELADLSSTEVERVSLNVGEAEVDKTIEVLRKQRTTWHPSDLPAGVGDRLVVDFTGRIDGEVFPGGEASDFSVVLGAGTMLPDFEAALSGMTAGGSRTFDLGFPEDYHARELAGRKAKFEVKVKRVEAPRLPDVDGDFARALGIAEGDLTRMRDEVRNNLEREVRKRIRSRVKEQVMRALLGAHPIDVPKALVEEESHQMSEAAARDFANRGMDAKNIGISPAWFAEQATRRVKLGLILAEVVKANGLHAQPDQIRSMVDDFAQSYEDPAEVVRWYYSQRQQLAQVEALVIEENVVDWVLAHAKVVDKPVAFDDLMGSAA